MKTAVDSSVLLDVFGADPRHGEKSRAALRKAYDEGALLACEVIFPEVRGHFPNDDSFDQAMGLIGVRFDSISAHDARVAGQLWRESRRRGSRRDRVVADFLVGAHAWHQADTRLSRDRGFYREYFAELTLVDPST